MLLPSGTCWNFSCTVAASSARNDGTGSTQCQLTGVGPRRCLGFDELKTGWCAGLQSVVTQQSAFQGNLGPADLARGIGVGTGVGLPSPAWDYLQRAVCAFSLGPS